MKELFNKIYDNVISYEEDTIEIGCVIDNEINNLIEPYKAQLTPTEMEVLHDLLCSISLTAKREGFLLGAKYSFKALLELLSK